MTQLFEIGTKVRGMYFDRPFTGVVTERRFNTMTGQPIHHVALDRPIDMGACGGVDPRTSVCVDKGIAGCWVRA